MDAVSPPSSLVSEDGSASPAILLIEDNPGDAELLRSAIFEALVSPGPSFVHAPTAMWAVRWLSGLPLKTMRPTLAICDYNLPGMTALEWLLWLRTDAQLGALPCYVLTGSANPDDSRRALDAGANGYLLKPMAWEQWLALANTINRLLDRHSILEPCSTRDDQKVLEAVCREIAVDYAAVRGDSQEQHVVVARNRATARLISMGWPAARISRVLSRSPRTVQRVRERMVF